MQNREPKVVKMVAGDKLIGGGATPKMVRGRAGGTSFTFVQHISQFSHEVCTIFTFSCCFSKMFKVLSELII